MKSIALKLLTALAFTVPAFAAEKDHKHEKKVAGPNGGMVITAVEPHLEFYVNKDRKVEITALSEDLKAAKLSGQVIAVTAGDRSKPTKLEFKEDGGKLVSTNALPDATTNPGGGGMEICSRATPQPVKIVRNPALARTASSAPARPATSPHRQGASA